MTEYTDALRQACFEAMPVVRFEDWQWPPKQSKEVIEARARQIMMESAENPVTENGT